jgi:hypothetical protein
MHSINRALKAAVDGTTREHLNGWEKGLAQREATMLQAIGDTLRDQVDGLRALIEKRIEPLAAELAELRAIVTEQLAALAARCTKLEEDQEHAARAIEDARRTTAAFTKALSTFPPAPAGKKRKLVVRHSDGTESTVREE